MNLESKGVRMKNLRGLLVAGSVIAATIGGSAALASPASADEVGCVAYLNSIGATVGSGARAACILGQNANWKNFGLPKCIVKLEGLNVSGAHATEACRRAGI
ncbi:hypothetical protein ACFVXE_28980 [Streptomyces sp. NPDC058231]|uniref:hypothetical protein n=1 Tax=Streptomyces sp. NPDC058231 TaxID=3346392 RepID=UPI0036F0E45F